MAIKSWQPGGGLFQVNDRVVRYRGGPRRYYNKQRAIKVGEKGTIVHDFGFDYRYLILLDSPVRGRMRHSTLNFEFDIRIGDYLNWKKI